MSHRTSIRLRLTALYAVLLLATTIALLGMSWWLIGNHLERTLPAFYADEVLGRIGTQYILATAGTMLIAIAVGWVVAGRAIAPLEAGAEAEKRFVANASHELRSPLTVIRTEAEVTLADPDAGEAELREMARVVLEATDRTEALLDGLLVLARSQRGDRRDDRVNLAALARRVEQSVAAEAAGAGVRLDVRAAPAIVRGDEPLLERMLANLTENAVRHNCRGGFAQLEIGHASGRAVVRVVNGGPAIPADAVARLAEPFQRLDRVPGAGSGLGLSIVRSVAEAHGGTLRLDARPEGGLAAEVSLPEALTRS